ncbi:hypothetical protein [Streptomyces gardneri]|uniref:Uncharacterized protein n=1 Tax=Streptomyces gardneri TaxID=66892 RepID=A0A4Y3RWQ8_9ACTN|nr:hypothetical protein [Streptomyces gardneri]GEB61825.1 hypothetical protein SGA01_74300 [Streptomyces gardneri]GHH07108.1 hypothetical protein GCM10017674_48230 [Streptomyces gardneri]
MTRMVRALSAIAVAAAALGVLAANGEPSWESNPAHSVVAGPSEPSWEIAPAHVILASPEEPSWEIAPKGAGE